MKRFYKHLSTWMFTSIFLLVLFLFLRVPPFVTLIVVGSWGMAVAAEAIDVFGFPGIGRDWEERKIQEELDRMNPSDNVFPMEDAEGLELDDQLDLEELKEVKKNWRDSDLV